jgi:hypothetical protein
VDFCRAMASPIPVATKLLNFIYLTWEKIKKINHGFDFIGAVKFKVLEKNL